MVGIDARNNGRSYNKIRPISVKLDEFGFANSSVLFKQGNTVVLSSISLQDGVPRFLRGKKQGWLTAEYSMLPCSTKKRIIRDTSSFQRNSRSVEISRLIGRVFRSVVDLNAFVDKTIIIDCDVLQADGGTRSACITAASIALKVAERRWLNSLLLNKKIMRDEVAGVSVGIINSEVVLDLDFHMDSSADVDFNFILT